MTDHDLRIRQHRGNQRCIALIVEDGRLKRRLDLGENAWRDRCGEMAEKQGFDKALPLPIDDECAIVGASASRGKEFGTTPTTRARGRGEGYCGPVALSQPHGSARPGYGNG